MRKRKGERRKERGECEEEEKRDEKETGECEKEERTEEERGKRRV